MKTNKFPCSIFDYVRLDFVKGKGTIAVVLEPGFVMLLDLTKINYNSGRNSEEARHYVGYMFCNYLKNNITEERLINDFWMNCYLEKKEIISALQEVQKNTVEFLKAVKDVRRKEF